MRTARIHPAPIIVLGNVKAGTSAIAALLASAAGKTVTLDFTYPYQDLPLKLHKGDLTIPARVQKYKLFFSRDIIKIPVLTYFYEDLARCFPNSKFVFIVRDPRDNIRSILNRLQIPGNLEHLDEQVKGALTGQEIWRPFLEGTMPQLEGNNYIERMAACWNMICDVFIEHSAKLALIRYEDFIVDKVRAIKSLAMNIGLVYVHDIDHLVDVQYQPKGDNTLSWLEFYGKENLERIERVCIDRMKYFGYV